MALGNKTPAQIAIPHLELGKNRWLDLCSTCWIQQTPFRNALGQNRKNKLGKFCLFAIMAEGGADTRKFIGHDRKTDAAFANENTPIELFLRNPFRDSGADLGIIARLVMTQAMSIRGIIPIIARREFIHHSIHIISKMVETTHTPIHTTPRRANVHIHTRQVRTCEKRPSTITKRSSNNR